ncbi:hypothetical protein B9Z55_016401 [Caenorhabditis nigoni]|uniref:Nose resistant-to-fluoxetine protein N-terminal domain-containing protein n=1 Tax=Caenorhabditis nigoni TaxID=1611254 RepID=A0A2G5T4F3_9PELO|nr:hypothetical protein B9Z55_016401 [Caenorhabditis nigoni]
MFPSSRILNFSLIFLCLRLVESSFNLFDSDNVQSFNFNPVHGFINYTGISNQCTKDIKTWINSLEIITKSSSECLLYKNCSAPVLKTLKDNMYAIQQYDAFGKIPSPGLFEIELIFDGSYQECRRISGVKYDTNYCYVVLIPGRNADCSGGNINNIGSQVAFRRAVCMPKSCGSGDIVNLYNQLSGLPLTACATFCSEREVPKDSSFWGFSIFMAVIISIAILATSVDYLRESLCSVTTKSIEKTYSIFRILYAFSFWTNASTILNVSPQPDSYIKCLDCIRGLSMAWVLSAHVLNYFLFSDTLMPIKSFASYFADSFFINANFSVDTFFLVSGITVAYSFFRMKPTSKILRSPSTWILFYVHRFIRLTPPYMIFIGFYTVYSLYIQGPLAASLFNFTVLQVEACKASWWRNLIYINNFDDGENPCYGPSWYLAVDTQLYLIAPILLIGLAWKPIFGIFLFIIGCVGSILTVYILYFKFDLPADSFHSDASGKFNFYIYQKPWIRCPPYLIGILVGYYLSKNPGTSKLQLYRKVFFMGISFVLPFCFLIANKGYDEGKHQLEKSYVKASYYNFSRFFWATSVGYIIVACHRGWAGPIGNFMNHPIWQPLGRLSYSAYIVHLMIVYYFLNVGAKPLHFVSTWQVYVYYILPATILTFTFAFFWSCLFEIPIMKLEKYLLEVLRMKKIRSEPAPAEVPAWKEHHIHI